MPKYILTDETIDHGGVQLTRIKRVSDGALGGFIEEEENLSQEGDCWVNGNAWVFGNAQVSGNAWVFGNAQVSGNAQVYGNALVYGDARVYGNAQVFGGARVYRNARINARISEGDYIGTQELEQPKETEKPKQEPILKSRFVLIMEEMMR